MQSAPLVPPAGESDATLGPGPVSASLRPAPVVTADKSGSKQGQKPGQVQQPAAAKPAKPKPFESVVAIALLSVAGAGAAIAGGWYWYAHRKPPAPPAPHAVTVTPPQPEPVPQQIESLPPAPAPVTTPETTPAKPIEKTSTTVPPPSPAKTTTKPPAGKPTPAKTTPPTPAQTVATVTPPAPVKPVQTTPPPPPAPTPAPTQAAAFDPRKADPNTNGKLKIDVSKFPKGLAFTVSMNNKPYVHFTTGDGASLDNLYAPPGMQQFQVSFKSAGQEWNSKPVSSDFKAKKSKTLKVQLLENDEAESKITLPIDKDAVLSISFSSSLANLF